MNSFRKQTTMVAPVGRFKVADKKRPMTEPIVLIMAEAHSC
jgi:hypothetical protein